MRRKTLIAISNGAPDGVLKVWRKRGPSANRSAKNRPVDKKGQWIRIGIRAGYTSLGGGDLYPLIPHPIRQGDASVFGVLSSKHILWVY